jgi:hypothetical protein
MESREPTITWERGTHYHLQQRHGKKWFRTSILSLTVTKHDNLMDNEDVNDFLHIRVQYGEQEPSMTWGRETHFHAEQRTFQMCIQCNGHNAQYFGLLY